MRVIDDLKLFLPKHFDARFPISKVGVMRSANARYFPARCSRMSLLPARRI